MTEELTAKEKVTINRVGKIKMARLSVKLYNSLCSNCKLKVVRNPKMSIESYCNKCKAKAIELYSPILEVLNK